MLGKYPHQLSGGQLQRLMIARALLLELKFLVADEIISMLDASTRIDVLNLLGDLKARGVGILFITHDLSLGNYISDKTLILRRGRIAEYGPTPKVFGNPSHPYTQALLASVPQLHRKWTTTAGAGRARHPRLGWGDHHEGRPGRGRAKAISWLSTQERNHRDPGCVAALHRSRRVRRRLCRRACGDRGPGFDGVELYDLCGRPAAESVRSSTRTTSSACGRHAVLPLVETELESLAQELRRSGRTGSS